MKNVSFLFLFVPLLFLAVPLPKSAAAEDAPDSRFQPQLEEIKTRLGHIESLQQESAAKDEKILEELDRLRVWVRRK